MKHIISAECTGHGVTLHWSDGTTTYEKHEHPTLPNHPVRPAIAGRRGHNGLRFRPKKAQVLTTGGDR